MAINRNADINELKNWLNKNLQSTNPFVPHKDAIPKIISKGIYFWFMRPNGYKVLGEYVKIQPIDTRYTKDIYGEKYDLVYIGTSGTGKKGNSTIYDRLKWHINQNHGKGEICHGTLSTFRAGLAALLADDLIIPNTESLVNTFMKDYMKVFWIEYPNDKLLIDNAENQLIEVLRPLLNLKNNPNAKANAPFNSTKVYKSRRTLVYNNSKQRLGCN